MADTPAFATVDPFNGMNENQPGVVQNLCNGQWLDGAAHRADLPDPLSGSPFLRVPDTTNFDAYIDALNHVPKCGVHHPLFRPER